MNTETQTLLSSKKFDRLDLIKRIAVIAIPVALQNLLSTTGSMIDTMMISSLGERYVASVGLCGQYSFLMFSCYWGFIGGGCLFFSQFWGAKDEKGISKSYGLTLTCIMTVAVLFAVFGICFPKLVLKLYTDKEAIQTIGISYLKIVAWAYPMQVLSIGMSSLLRCTERVKIPLYASIASVATNTFLNWILIFGHLGAPALGVEGAAIATVIASFINVLVIAICALATKYPYLFKFKEFFKWDKQFLEIFFGKCLPILANELLIGIGNMVINIVLGHQVEEAIAAVAVFRTIEGMIIGFFVGFSSAASILVGKSVGAGETKQAYERAIRIVYLCQATILIAVIGLFIFHSPLLHVMHLSGLSFDFATGTIIIYGIACVIRMGNWTQNDTYRSAGDAIYGTMLEIIFMYSLVIPALLLTNFVLKAPFLVVFAMCYIDEPIRYILMQIHMYSGKWIKPVTPEGKLGLEKFLEERKAKQQTGEN